MCDFKMAALCRFANRSGSEITMNEAHILNIRPPIKIPPGVTLIIGYSFRDTYDYEDKTKGVKVKID